VSADQQVADAVRALGSGTLTEIHAQSGLDMASTSGTLMALVTRGVVESKFTSAGMTYRWPS